MKTLQNELDELKQAIDKQLPVEASRAFDEAIAETQKRSVAKTALRAGMVAPDFALEDTNGQVWRLSTALEERPVVLSFFRGGWCPYCSLELRSLQRELARIAESATLVAVAPQTQQASVETRAKLDLSYPVLSDLGSHVAVLYSVSFTLPEAVRPVYRSLGIDFSVVNGDATFQLPVPATFIISRNRTIVRSFADEDYTRRLDPLDILASLRSIGGDAT